MRSNMRKIANLFLKNVFPSGIILCVFVFLWPLQAKSAENEEQTLTFSGAAAVASLRPDRAGPLSPNVLTSSRFSLSHVHVLGKELSRNSQMPELEPVETFGAFFGLKITLQLKGGWNTFSGGDVKKGIGGMFDNAFHVISASGAPIIETRKESNHAGLEFGGDLIYCITPRFGIGIGASRISARKKSAIIYRVGESTVEELRTRPEIKVTVLRLGMFYAFPFAGRLAISVHGGPALYSAKYIYDLGRTSGGPGLPENYMQTIDWAQASTLDSDVVFQVLLPGGLYQEATAKELGLEGGVGFEFNANPFVALFVEALGRYAKIGGFEGETKTTDYQKAGSLHYVDTGLYPLLDIIPPEGPATGNVRKATLDFSGFSLSAGLKLRF